MYPELFTFNLLGKEITIIAYSFFYTLAILFVIGGSYLTITKNGFSRKVALRMLFFVTLASLTGARLLHWGLNPTLYTSEQLSPWALQLSGFTIVGGLISATVVGIIVGKFNKIEILRFGDLVVPYLGLSIAIARIGCFLNGCCFGKVTSVPWGVKFPILSYAHLYQLTHGVGSFFTVLSIHPTQIYEMLATIAGAIIAIIINRKHIFHGAGIIIFGGWFSLFRAMNMFFRQMPDSLILSSSGYAILYLSIFIFLMIIFFYKYKGCDQKKHL